MTTLSIDHQFTFAPMVTLGSEKFAWLSVVWAILWSRTGYYMIIFLAALLSIPSSLYEAAEVDGASKWQKFWYVTWPSLKSARLMVLILVTMEIFKTFPLVVTLTSGGPFDATKFAVMYIYERAFDWKEIGYASAMSVIMLIFVTIISVINFRFSKGGSNE
jgi:alpha-1,4-digalacturonate transport system permease protein